MLHERRARMILDAINGPVSAAELGHRLWRDAPGFDGYLVLSEVLGHLELLEESGRVRGLEDEGLVRWEPISPAAWRADPLTRRFLAAAGPERTWRLDATARERIHHLRRTPPPPRPPTADPRGRYQWNVDSQALAIANAASFDIADPEDAGSLAVAQDRSKSFAHPSLQGDEPVTILIVEHRRKLSKRVQLHVSSRSLLVGN